MSITSYLCLCRWRKPLLAVLLGSLSFSMALADSAAVTTIYSVEQSKKSIKVNGTVTDENNEALPGVNITLKGTTVGTITDIDGHFFIEVPSPDTYLLFSFIGYKPYEVRVGKQININVILKEEAEALDEVVVVGYGNQKKLSVVGSIQTLEPAKLQSGTSRTLSNNLAGQLAGVIAYQPSGEPGYDTSNFWIRGISSFTGNTSPLMLVDGIERNLNDLDPAEIESFSILKDASASAMYGVRGANGVILINTKRGKVAAPSIDFRIEQSIQAPTKLPGFLGAVDYMNLLDELATDVNKPLPFSREQIDRTLSGYDRDLYPDVDWLDAVTKDYANNTRANLTVAGGTPILRYSLTASVFRENGIMAADKAQAYNGETNLNRYNIRANVDLDLTKTTLLRFNVGGYLQELQKSKSSTDNIFTSAFETPPFVHPAVYSDGTIPKRGKDRSNPWANATQTGYYRSGQSKLESLFSLEQDLKMITPGLKVKGTFSFDTYSVNYVTRGKDPDYYMPATSRDDEGNLKHSILSYGQEFLGHSNNADFGNRSVYFEFAATYNRMFAQKHIVDALFLYNQRSYDDGGIQPFRHQGIAGRLSYTYDRRYVAEFNFGYNGSENFAKGHRFGFFPSVAAGWLLSEEPFMENVRKVLDKVKIRGSIGKVGNDGINGRRFAYITTVTQKTDGYKWGDEANYDRGEGIKEGDYGVDNLTWETVTKANLGLELGILNALELQVDIFKEKRTNIFMQRTVIPTQTGFINNPWANLGKVDNQGIDLSLVYTKRLSKNLLVSLRGNYTYARNKIIETDEPESIKGTYRSKTGLPINTLWGLEADGLYTIDDFDQAGYLKEGMAEPALGSDVRPGDIKYVDRNNDGIIDTKDEGYIGGTATPKIVYGFGGNVSWKQFDFSFFFQGTGDSYRIIGGTQYFIPGSGQGVLGNIYSNYDDRWTEGNPSQKVFWPRLSYSTNYNNLAASTWWKKNMSFLRLKNIELGYSLPKTVIQKIHAQGIRFYVSGNNLFYLSKFKLWDPELDTGDGLKYPAMRSLMVGVELKF